MFFKPKPTETMPMKRPATPMQQPVRPTAPLQRPVMPQSVQQAQTVKPIQTPTQQAVPAVQPSVGAQPVVMPQSPQQTQAAAPAETSKPLNQYAKPVSGNEREKGAESVDYAQETVVESKMEPHVETTENGDKVFVADSIKDVEFSDIWYTPEHVVYIRDKSTKFALIPFKTKDMNDFYKMLEQGYTGSSSYAGKFKGEAYRIERVVTTTGVQYNCRKMPVKTPNLYKLGLPESITKYLATLAPEAGLILFAGPTGMGKTTTASALMREFLESHGGFLYTIEDPPEMPLDGVYHAKNGALGLCKQSPVENERWEEGLKSALRSRPRYILVGEIRTPEVASQVLRAATSGHLVLSTIHAMSVEDALNSMLKYAAGAGLDEKLVADLLARGILAVIHQKLEGTTVLHPVIQTVFANPNPLQPDQMRSAIREGRISLGTLMEAQSTKLMKGLPMFKSM